MSRCLWFFLLIFLPGLCLADNTPTRPAVNDLADSYSQQGLAIFYAEEQQSALLFLGTRHTFDVDNFQVLAIEQFIHAFQPTVILIEGGQWPLAASKEQAVRHYSEFGLARWLATQARIRHYSFEPALEDEIAAVLAKHPPVETKLYYALRMVPQWAAVGDAQSVEKNMQHFLRPEKNLVNFGLASMANIAPRDLVEFKQLVASKLPALKDWRTIDFAYSNPGLPHSFFHTLKLTSGSVRNRALEKAMFAGLEKGERVLVLAGGAHLGGVLNKLMQYPATQKKS